MTDKPILTAIIIVAVAASICICVYIGLMLFEKHKLDTYKNNNKKNKGDKND